jgi:hypothetical protein
MTEKKKERKERKRQGKKKKTRKRGEISTIQPANKNKQSQKQSIFSFVGKGPPLSHTQITFIIFFKSESVRPSGAVWFGDLAQWQCSCRALRQHR